MSDNYINEEEALFDVGEEAGATLGDVFPALRERLETFLDDPLLDTRSLTTLRRLGAKSWGDVAEHTFRELRKVPGAGALTLNRILTAARRRNEELGGLFSPPGALNTTDSGLIPESASASPVLVALREIGVWAVREREATKFSDLLKLSDGLGEVPAEIEEGIRLLDELDLSRLLRLPSAAIEPSLACDLFETVERSEIVIERKVRQGKPPTLQEIADKIGLTRERVRQIETKIADALAKQLSTEQFAPLRWRAADLRKALGAMVPADSPAAEAALERACRDLDEPVAVSLHEVLLWLAGPYVVDEDRWIVRDGASFRSKIEAFNTAFADDVVIEREDAEMALHAFGLRTDVADAFLARSGGWRSIDENTWVKWSGPVGNKAEAVLRLVGEPMVVEDINTHIGEGHATTSLRNAMSIDPRFVRIDKANRYGLAEWGLEEYSGIAQEIRERIERQGGRAEVDALVAEFVSKFGVSETSVRMYAGSPAFVIEDGWVRLRGDDEPFEAGTSISAVKGLFINEQGDVITHVDVDFDVLRGSGRQFYTGAATALGVAPGGRREFRGPNDTRVVVTWPETSVMGPSLGSVRSFALDLNLSEGDRLRVVLSASADTCRGERVSDASLRELTGIESEPGEELASIARAIGVPVAEVRMALRDRGDDQVLDLLPEVQVSSDIQDAISQFGDLLG